MDDELNLQDSENSAAVKQDDRLYGKKIVSVPKPNPNIGIDTEDSIYKNIINAGTVSVVDASQIESFTQISQNRGQIYDLLDAMSEDSTIAAVLETYCEDATERNDDGKIVWCEAADPDVSKTINFLLESMCVEKNIYKWVYSLCKYGDLYIRLYKKSEVKDLLFDDKPEEKEPLNENLKFVKFGKNDHYVEYVEMVPNPAEMFELTKFGKTYAYIQAPTTLIQQKQQTANQNFQSYSFNVTKDLDTKLYEPVMFVHACLEDNFSRTPEKVQLFIGETEEETREFSYTVRKGQSLLFNVFKIWREMVLLENAILLNRLTRSSVTRVISVEVGDMSKNDVQATLYGVKQKIEQKGALNIGNSLSEYTNPGPTENNVYLSTHDGVGAITTTQIGGDVDSGAGNLSDLEHFQDKMFGALRVPKQYFGVVNDDAGFSGGESLSLISSRYAKMVKRIQSTVCQAIEDIMNLMLIDKGLSNMIGKFRVKMLAPTTSEEKDRQDNLSTKLAVARDTVDMLADVDDNKVKLKALKSLLSSVINNQEVIELLGEYIDSLEEEGEDAPLDDADFGDEPVGGMGGDDDFSFDEGPSEPREKPDIASGEFETAEPLSVEDFGDGDTLPTPGELNADIDFSDNNAEL